MLSFLCSVIGMFPIDQTSQDISLPKYILFFEAANIFVCRQMNVRCLTMREAQMIFALIQLKQSSTGNMHAYLQPMIPSPKDKVRLALSTLVKRGYIDRSDTFIYSPTPKSFDYVSRINRYLKHKRLTNLRRYRIDKK